MIKPTHCHANIKRSCGQGRNYIAIRPRIQMTIAIRKVNGHESMTDKRINVVLLLVETTRRITCRYDETRDKPFST